MIFDLNVLYAPFLGLKKQEIIVQGQRTPWNPDPVQNNDERGFKKVNTQNVSCIMLTLYWFNVIWWLLSLMNCYYKACFFDVMLAMLYLSSIYFNQPPFTERLAQVFIGLIVLSIILDIVWLVFYFDPWWNTAYVDDGKLDALRKYITIMTIIVLIAKCVLCVLFFYVSRYIKRSSRNMNLPFLTQGIPLAKDSPSYNNSMVIGGNQSNIHAGDVRMGNSNVQYLSIGNIGGRDSGYNPILQNSMGQQAY